MKKLFSVVFITLLLSVSLFSAQHISVPLTHRAYDVIASAELRGIIKPMATVKPYPKSVIIENLQIILESNMVNEGEAEEIRQTIKELTNEYTQPYSPTNLLKTGAYATYWEEVGIGVAFGANFEFEFAQGLHNTDLFDSRNVARAYFKGDILQSISFNMDFGLRFDQIEPHLFLPNDFTVPTEGEYDEFWDRGGEHLLYIGLDMHPELAMSFQDSNIQLRFGSIKRDWGVGQNNFMLAGSASSFNGIELAVNFSSWFQYNFIAGSLGKFWPTGILLTPANTAYYNEYYFSDGQQGTRLENNLSAHRVEVKIPWNISLGIYESVLYKKRFEIGYLNPVTILMFEQNLLGDFDNMLAGIDFQWRLPGILRLYGTAATSEMHEISPARFFIAPRNILSMQGGIDVHLPIGQFSKFTFQYTYLAPFFYTHYPMNRDYDKTEAEDTSYYDLWYVNKGQNIGYPLRPNSDEFLVTFDVGLPQGWRTSLTAKYQRRSGQYGFNIDKYMVYSATSEYEDKKFTENLFEKTLGLDFTVAKTFDSYPITIKATYMYTLQTDRGEPNPVKWWMFPTTASTPTGSTQTPTDPVPAHYHPIAYEVTGPWSNPSHTHALQLGVSIWR